MSDIEKTILNTNEVVKVQDIISGNVNINMMDLTMLQNREVLLSAIKQRQNIALQLNAADQYQREVLKSWIKEDYKNLLVLKNEQQHVDLVDAYLYGKFCGAIKADGDVSIIRSYNGQQVINYNYETRAGETLSYFDKNVGIPTSLKTKALFKIKITNAINLIKKVDVQLERIDLGLTVNFINNLINDSVRDVIFEVIDKNKINFYDLTRFYALINGKLIEYMNSKLVDSGLEVADVRIINITIPSNTGEILEKQFFALAEQKRIKQYENRLEAESLKLYEAKAAIHNKYPDFPISMTEAEKDMALDRYMKRIGTYKAHSADIEKENLEERADAGNGTVTAVDIDRPVEPEKPTPKYGFRTAFIILALLMIGACIAVICVGGKGVMIGALVLAVVVVMFALIFFMNRSKFLKGLTKQELEEYNKKKEEYESSMEAYSAKYSENIK